MKNKQQNQRQLFYENNSSGVKMKIATTGVEVGFKKNAGSGPGVMIKDDSRQRLYTSRTLPAPAASVFSG